MVSRLFTVSAAATVILVLCASSVNSIPKCIDGYSDIIIVADTSESSKEEFVYIQKFIKELNSRIPLSQTESLMTMTFYSDGLASYNFYRSNFLLTIIIDGMTPKWGTEINLHQGFGAAEITFDKYGRKDAHKFVVSLQSAPSSDRVSALAEAVKLKNSGVTMLALDYGEEDLTNEISQYASGSNYMHAYSAQVFSLDHVLDAFIGILCKSKNDPLPPTVLPDTTTTTATPTTTTTTITTTTTPATTTTTALTTTTATTTTMSLATTAELDPKLQFLVSECISGHAESDAIYFLEYLDDPSKFIHCVNEGGVLYVALRTCPFGTIWRDSTKECLDATLAQGNLNPCNGISDANVAYGINCGAYWNCTDEVPDAVCCPRYQEFSPSLGECMPNEQSNCYIACDITKATHSVKDCKRFKPASKTALSYIHYMENIWNDFWVRRLCAPGSEYVEPICTCDTIGERITLASFSETTTTTPISTFYENPKECKNDLLITFTNGVEDEATRQYLGKEGNFVISEGLAIFTKSESAISYRFSSVDWSTGVYIYVRFIPEDGHGKQSLVGNCDCSSGPSFQVGLDYNGAASGEVDVVFIAYSNEALVGDEEHRFTIKTGELVEASLYYHNDVLVLKANDNELTIDGSDKLDQVVSPLVIGGKKCTPATGCNGYSNFIGKMDELRVSLCSRFAGRR